MTDVEAQLAKLEHELQRAVSAPTSDIPAVLDHLLVRLRAVPLNVLPERRVALLTDVATHHYFHGQSVVSAVEPISLAVMLAEQNDFRPLLRRALSCQGLIFAATRQFPDALRSLLRALDLAEGSQHLFGIPAAWFNLAITFLEATLYSDAEACFERAMLLGEALPENEPNRLRILTRALHGKALCALYRHAFLEGVDACDSALSRIESASVTATEPFAVVVLRCTSAELLLALDRVDDAHLQALAASELAPTSGSARATISATMINGLVEVFRGNIDCGIGRVLSVFEEARSVAGCYPDALRFACAAYERAGRLDRALAVNRELMLHIRNVQRDALTHQRQSWERLGISQADKTGAPTSQGSSEARPVESKDASSKQATFLEHFVLAVDRREEGTGEHAFRVAMWAHLLALEHGIDPEEAKRIELAARLHDIGKLVIPDSVIRRQDALTPSEWQLIQTHAAAGSALLARSSLPYAALAAQIAGGHHEAWSGQGYPAGLAGEAIPVPARIVAVCNAFDSLVHNLPWRPAFTVDQALQHLTQEKGRQFDPALVDRFSALAPRIYAQHEDVDAYLLRLAQPRGSIQLLNRAASPASC